jgi:hypothetical protein
MTMAELVAELAARNVKIEAVDGRLRLDVPKGALAAGLRAALTEHKAELLALLERQAAPPTSAPGRAERAGSIGENLPTAPTSERGPLLISALDAGGTVRIPLDDLVHGDFLERNRLRIVGGTAYPDGRTYRPTIYLADDVR